MKKTFSIVLTGILFLSMCLFTACGNSEPKEPVPKYNTLGITLEELIDKMNSSGDYTKTWSKDFSTEKMEDGKTKFESNTDIVDAHWSGTYETSSKEIISLTISHHMDEYDLVNAKIGMATACGAVRQILNIDTETALNKIQESFNSDDNKLEYNDYILSSRVANIDTVTVTADIETEIYPINELKQEGE